MVQKSEMLVTMFGGGGMIGRHVAQALFRAGVRVRVAQRDPRRAFFLKPLGALGQSQFVQADVTDRASVARALDGADMAINLVGILKGNFDLVHVEGAANVAGEAAARGLGALLHMSAIGADPASLSNYGRTKGEGEAAVRVAFPGATILRPSVVAAVEDNFINRFAKMARYLPALPVIRGDVRFQPVWAPDVGRAAAAALLDPAAHGGRTYELGGPQVMTLREIMRWVAEATGRENKPLAELPDALVRTMARVGGWLPGAPITWDQWLMLQQDNVVASGADGFEALGIRPAPLAAVAEGWLTPFRRGGRFASKSPY
jgi:uncharacterized protein YbjT (DUF2867 family)